MDSRRVTEAFERHFAEWRAFFLDAFVCLGVNGISGDYVEFGSEGANTLSIAYDCSQVGEAERHFWAFDSFEGLPASDDDRDRHPMWTPGVGSGEARFHELCAERGVPRSAYTVVTGYYDVSLPPLGDHRPPEDIALAYVDCNMYSSTVTVLEFLAPRLKHGMIVAFDDYFCWSDTEISGERVALAEFELVHPEWRFLPLKPFHWSGQAFAVERADKLPRA